MGHGKNLRLFKSPKLGHFIQKVEADRKRAGDLQQKGKAQNAKRREYDSQLRQRNRSQPALHEPNQGSRNHKQPAPMDYREYQRMLREHPLHERSNPRTDRDRGRGNHYASQRASLDPLEEVQPAYEDS